MSDFDVAQDWKKLISVQAGGVICLPIFIIGHALAKTYGMPSAILAIVLGNALLLGMGLVAASTSAVRRKSTAQCAVDVFGSRGKVFFSGAMVFSMVGWFAIQMNIMTTSLQDFFGRGVTILLNVALGAGMTAVAIKGMKGLAALANLSMPFLVATIAYAIYLASDAPVLEATAQPFTAAGISLVLACAIAAVIDLPTFFRLAKTRKDGMLAACLLFGLVLPFVEGVGVYLFIHSRGDNIVEVLTQEGSPALWKAWVMVFLILAGWTTNNANLYSAAVSFNTLMPMLSDRTRTILAGALGTFLSCLNLLDHLVLALDVIGIILGSMGAVMVFHFAYPRGDNCTKNVYAWLIGVAGGFCSYFGYSLLQIPVLDAFLIAFLTKFTLEVRINEKTLDIRS